MKIYELEFEICDKYDGYDERYTLGVYSSKELAINAAKEMLIKSAHTLRDNLLAEADYVETIYDEKVTYFVGPNFLDNITKAVDNSIYELRTEGTACLDYLQVKHYFRDEIISLNLIQDEMNFDKPAMDIIKPYND